MPPAARVNRALECGRVDMRIERARIVEYRATLARTLKPPQYFPPRRAFLCHSGKGYLGTQIQICNDGCEQRKWARFAVVESVVLPFHGGPGTHSRVRIK